MTKKIKLAIVGRPNVGKSLLFNRICKKRIAIVDEAEGVTRDRLYAETNFFGKPLEIIDTGGINARSKAIFNEEIKRQAEIAIEEADTLIMVVEAKAGVTSLDAEVAQILHSTRKSVCLAINKVDNTAEEQIIHEFHSLGFKHMVAVSAEQNWHIAELLEASLKEVNDEGTAEDKDTSVRVAIVGRPNVGKSSLINYVLDEERCIVSPIPGTTRDSVDVIVKHEAEQYTFIDTAGIRRKHAEHDVVDKFATIRTERAIERANICLLMLDAQQGLTTQEKRIAKSIEDLGKGCGLIFNKWDLVKGFRMEHCLKCVEEEVPFLRHCPKLMTSATTGRNVEKIFSMINEINSAMHHRVSTPQLNKFIEDAMQRNHPPMLRGKRLRIYYMAQVGVDPPRFVMFVNHPDLMSDHYLKYLYNQFRRLYPFPGVPLIFQLKGKGKKLANNTEIQ